MMETRDLILGRGSVADWEDLYHNLWSREEVFSYLFSSPSPDEEAGMKRTCTYAEMQKEVKTEFFVYEIATGQAIGIAGIKELSPGCWTITDIAIGPDFWGKGYGKQIVQALIGLAFRECGAKELSYCCFSQNKASYYLARSCGFSYCHSQKGELLKDGETVTLLHFKMDASLGGRKSLNREQIRKTEEFLKSTFAASEYLQKHPTEAAYRLEHSYRVANIAKLIAEKQWFDVTQAAIAGLLHDIAYCEEMTTPEERRNHGRRSAQIARPFLVELGLSSYAVNEICYGIAIHVDDEADFQWKRSSFCETVGDADNLDRFDAYRIYETLQYQKFNELPLGEKREKVASLLEKLNRFKEMKLGTYTAREMWLQRLDYYISFYEKLKAQLANSSRIF